MATTFTADLKRFRDLTSRNMRYVAINAIQDVMEAAQTPQLPWYRRAGGPERGKIPVDTADLINSLVSGLASGGGTRGATSYAAVIAGLKLGDVFRFEWNSEHALRVELGFTGKDELGREFNQQGAHFVGANAARFSDFVAARVAEVRR